MSVYLVRNGERTDHANGATALYQLAREATEGADHWYAICRDSKTNEPIWDFKPASRTTCAS